MNKYQLLFHNRIHHIDRNIYSAILLGFLNIVMSTELMMIVGYLKSISTIFESSKD